MKAVLTFKVEGLDIVIEYRNNKEREVAVNGIQHTRYELGYSPNMPARLSYDLDIAEDARDSTVEAPEEPEIDRSKPISDKQIKLMHDWNIPIPQNCSSKQAISLINEYKLAHGLPITEMKRTRK